MAVMLRCGDYQLGLDPARGGCVTSFRWRGESLFAEPRGIHAVDSACFPLVPFSNRIADSRFIAAGRTIELAPNHPHDPDCPVIHGFGWLGEWHLVSRTGSHAELGFAYDGGEWPWRFSARQGLTLDAGGLAMTLAARNEAASPMPVGMGFHPSFPMSPGCLLHSLHHGEWQTDSDVLPTHLVWHDDPVDWWEGQPVATRSVDTGYAERVGPIRITWPERDLALTMHPDRALSHTVIYTPAGASWFCVEPVTHATNAINLRQGGGGIRWLNPGEEWRVGVRIAAHRPG